MQIIIKEDPCKVKRVRRMPAAIHPCSIAARISSCLRLHSSGKRVQTTTLWGAKAPRKTAMYCYGLLWNALSNLQSHKYKRCTTIKLLKGR